MTLGSARPGDEDMNLLSLNERDAEVVRAIEEEGLSVFTFDGLRRMTGVHPETLSRALDRLEDEGVLAKVPDGYATTEVTKTARPRLASVAKRRTPILHTFLPYGVGQDAIVSTLKGRWFDRVRWVGMSESEADTVMKWVTDDGAVLIDVTITSGQLDVEAKTRTDSDLASAVRAAYQIAGRISRMYGSTRPGSRPSLLRIGCFGPLAM